MSPDRPRARAWLLIVAAGAVATSCTDRSTDASPAAEPAVPVSDEVRFRDVAGAVGLDFRHGAFRWSVSPDVVAMMGTGVCWIDYDGDGWLDLFVVNSYADGEIGRWEQEGGTPRSAMFHNTEGAFTDVSRAAGAAVDGQGTGCVAADFDLDGHTDLYVTGARAGTLLWNDGDGSFTEATDAAGVEAFGWYAGAAVADVDGNGWPDLFLAGYANLNNPLEGATQGFPNTHAGVRDLLYLNDGPGDGGRVTFREVGMDAGLEVVNFTYGLGAVFSDVDRDGDLDLYVANDTNPDRLYENVAWPAGAAADPAGIGFRFEEVAAKAGVADPGAGMGVAEGDFDGDGRPDLFVSNARGQVHGVFRGETSARRGPAFVDVRADIGPDLSASTGWGVSWSDLDLDTDLDVVLVNGGVPVTDLVADAEPISAFENRTAQGVAGQFADASDKSGLLAIGTVNARGSAAADYDNDGDLDVAVATVGGPLLLLENSGTPGHWLEVSLDGFAPGAVITAVLPDGRELIREVQAGGSYLSSEDPRAHFGLGSADRLRELVVDWPSGDQSRLEDVDVNRVVILEPPG